ncbi:recombinase RecT [Cetobacterium ceti]
MTTQTIKQAKNSIMEKNAKELQNQISPTLILQNLLKENSKKLKAVLGDNANAFMVSLVNLYNSDLSGCDPQSVLNAAFIAAALKLPIEKNLGFAYIIKYGKQAQFILGYKGMLQLALRSGGVRKLNAIPIKKGQIKLYNPLTEEIEFDLNDNDGEIIGYAAYMELINGFNKTLYLTKENIEAHANKFSKTYEKDKERNEYEKKSVWSKNYDEMALKTIIKKILKFAPLSTDMQLMETVDQSSIKKIDLEESTGTININTIDVEYVDNKKERALLATKEEVQELLENANMISYDIVKISKQQGIDFENMTKEDIGILQSIIDDETAKRI